MNIFLKYQKVVLIPFLLVLILLSEVYAQVDMTIIVAFDQAPTTATVIKAPLKYNKDFALSMQIDDGHESIFTHAYPVFMGGDLSGQTYPGFTFTDGCGNDINFNMSTAQFSFNGNGENGPDTHVPGSGYGQVTWPQMDTLYKNGWGIINHAVNGDANTASDFMEYSLNRNKSYTRRNLINTTEGGVLTRVHVNPNGQIPWSQASFDLGYVAALNQDNNSSFMGDHGGNVNSATVDWLEPQNLYRLHNNDIIVTDYVGDLADSSVNGANYWGVIFTHSIGGEYPTTSFITDFINIEANFGKNGLDNILMTNDEEIINYLLIRDSLSLNYTLVGSTLVITLNGELPDDMRYYAASLVINADENISNITVVGADSTNHSSYGSTEGLINLFWDGEYIIPAEVLADSLTTVATNTQNQRDCWVAMDYVIVLENGFHKDSLRSVLCDIPGTVYDDGFCIDCSIDLGPDVTICDGECDSIYGPDDFDTYEWIVADTVFANSQDIFVCPINTTQYILNVENTFCVTSDTIVYFVDPSPQFDLGNDTTLCLNDSLTIYGPDSTGLNYTFEWIVADTLFDTTQNITVSPLDTTHYFLNISNEFNCTETDSIWVFVLEIPVAEIIQPDTLTACLGDSTDFTVQGSGIDSYLWSTGETTQSIRVSPAIADSTYKYYVDIFNSSGCFISDTAWLEVNPDPEVQLANDTTLCINDSLTIYGPDTTGLNYTFEWIVADTLFDTTQNITVSPTDTTHYFLNITNEFNCTETDSIWVFVLEIPIAEIIQNDTLAACLGDSTDFTVEGSGIDSYLWSTGDTTQSIRVSPSIADSTYKYYVDIFNANGCFISDTAWLEVNPVPEVQLANDTTLCFNDSLTLYGPDTTGLDYTFAWIVADTLYDTTQNITVAPVDTTMYILNVTNTSSCVGSDSIWLNILENPVAEITSADTVSACYGDSTTFTVEGTDIDSYLWNTGDTTQSIKVSPGTPDTTYKYYVDIFNESGCYISDTVWLIVKPIIFVDILFDTTYVCSGDEVKVSVYVDQPIMVEYFIWHYYDNIDTLTSPSITFTPDVSVNLYVQVVSRDSCDFWDSTYVQVNENASIVASDDETICRGDTTTISASGANMYYWLLGQDTISTESSLEVFPEYTTKYKVIGVMESGCQGIDSVFVNILPSPETQIIYQGTNPVCMHGLVTLFANGADEYWWSTDETTEEISFVIEEETLIELFGTDNNGCSSIDSIRLFVKPADIVSFTGLLPAYCENDPASILVGSPGGGIFSGSGVVGNEFRPGLAGTGPKTVKYSYTNAENCTGIDSVSTVVYGAGVEIDLGGEQTIHPAETIELDAGDGFDNYYWSTGSTYRNIIIHYGDNPPGSIIRYVVMGVINGCTSQGEVYITFADPYGIGENSSSRFVLFPNPNSGTFTISYLDEVQDFKILVYDYYGKLLLSKNVDCNPECRTDIELQGLTKGLYIIKTISEKGVSSGKLIIN